LKINALHLTVWMFDGIIGEAEMLTGHSHSNSTAYGFAQKNSSCRAGKSEASSVPEFKLGDRLAMMISESDLKMKIQRFQTRPMR